MRQGWKLIVRKEVRKETRREEKRRSRSRIEVESRVGLKTLGLCRQGRTHDDFELDRASSPLSALSGLGFWLIGSFSVRKDQEHQFDKFLGREVDVGASVEWRRAQF